MDLRSAFTHVIFLLVVFIPVTVSIHLRLNVGEKNYMPYSIGGALNALVMTFVIVVKDKK